MNFFRYVIIRIAEKTIAIILKIDATEWMRTCCLFGLNGILTTPFLVSFLLTCVYSLTSTTLLINGVGERRCSDTTTGLGAETRCPLAGCLPRPSVGFHNKHGSVSLPYLGCVHLYWTSVSCCWFSLSYFCTEYCKILTRNYFELLVWHIIFIKCWVCSDIIRLSQFDYKLKSSVT